MTCIVAIRNRGKVYVGGDSAATDSDTMSLSTRVDRKVFVVRGEFAFGFAASWRLGQLLKWRFVPPEHEAGMSDEQFMNTEFIDSIRTVLKAYGHNKLENSTDSSHGQFIVGYRGQIYIVDTDYHVGVVAHEYAAIGSGADVALGAMFAIGNKIGAEKRIRIALKAAAEFNASVRQPFHVIAAPWGRIPKRRPKQSALPIDTE